VPVAARETAVGRPWLEVLEALGNGEIRAVMARRLVAQKCLSLDGSA
jgi:hypothetical protein